jgi:tRNA(adenine34) deaminase
VQEPQNIRDREMMLRCIALSQSSGSAGEYPYAAIIVQGDTIIASSTNQVRHDHDVTRHAEVVAISAAQKKLRSVSLDDCTIYANAEPCAYCCYAIRETRISRVVYGLHSPHMGGVSKWNILGDEDLSNAMPEVFAPPPEIVGGFMASEAQQALIQWNPLVAKYIEERGLFGVAPMALRRIVEGHRPTNNRGLVAKAMAFLRREFFDRFGRR